MMPQSGRIRLVRPPAAIINHKKGVYQVTSYRAALHFWRIRFSKISQKQFIEHFFLTKEDFPYECTKCTSKNML